MSKILRYYVLVLLCTFLPTTLQSVLVHHNYKYHAVQVVVLKTTGWLYYLMVKSKMAHIIIIYYGLKQLLYVELSSLFSVFGCLSPARLFARPRPRHTRGGAPLDGKNYDHARTFQK
jgi:hypothetical protein